MCLTLNLKLGKDTTQLAGKKVLLCGNINVLIWATRNIGDLASSTGSIDCIINSGAKRQAIQIETPHALRSASLEGILKCSFLLETNFDEITNSRTSQTLRASLDF